MPSLIERPQTKPSNRPKQDPMGHQYSLITVGAPLKGGAPINSLILTLASASASYWHQPCMLGGQPCQEGRSYPKRPFSGVICEGRGKKRCIRSRSPRAASRLLVGYYPQQGPRSDNNQIRIRRKHRRSQCSTGCPSHSCQKGVHPYISLPCPCVTH